MVHNPKHKVHSFRGLLGDGGQDEINLERQNVNLAYRIVKLEVMLSVTGVDIQSVTKIYREEQASVPAPDIVDFTETDLLGAAVLIVEGSGGGLDIAETTIFDNTLFSRNIYVTHRENQGSQAINYYIELEEVPVAAATLMQLKLQVARKLNLQQD